MKKVDKKRRRELTLLASTFVLSIIFFSFVIALMLVHVLTRTGVIASVDGRPDITHVLLFMILISAAVGFLMAALMGETFIRPINSFIDKMNQLASGDFKTRIDAEDIKEDFPVLEELACSFNKMAEELENTEMLRSDFINNFSHELKTPVVSIAGFARLLKKGNLTQEQSQEYLEVIEEEALRLSNMVTNVLRLTKIQNQTILTDLVSYNLSEQLRSSVLLLENKWAENQIEFDMEFGEYQIRANEEMLKQVWINLVDNAIKFTEPGGTITIQIREQDGQICVQVKNPGKEIPPERLERIFQKFYQADESHASEGNGIGLAIVKRVVELHKGTVGVQSENGYTTFFVNLPDNGEKV